MSANRRDRFTSRLPMLTPPHREGGVGALRVEVRGADETGARVTLIAGIAEMVGTATAATASGYLDAFLNGRAPRRPGSARATIASTRRRSCTRSNASVSGCRSSPGCRVPDPAVTSRRSRPDAPPPWLPRGEIVLVPGRGEFFVRRHVHPDPDAPTVLLLHGWTASADLQFMAAYRALGERFSFVGIDHRGHGRGFRSTQPFELDDVADDAAAVAAQLGITLGHRRRLLDGRPGRAPPRASPPRTRCRSRRAGHGARVAGAAGPNDSSGACCLRWVRRCARGPSRVLLRRGVAYIVPDSSPFAPYRPWMIAETMRNEPRVMMQAGTRAESVRRTSVGAVARRAGGDAGLDPRSPRQAAQAARAGPGAAGDGRRGPDGPPRGDRDARSVRVGDARARVVGCRGHRVGSTPSAMPPCRSNDSI